MNPNNRNTSIKNFIWLIIFAWLIRAWFAYYPQSAIATLSDLRARAVIQLDQWFGPQDTQPTYVYNEPLIISNATDQTGSKMMFTGEMIESWDILLEETTNDSDSTWMMESWNNMVRSELDAFTTSTSTDFTGDFDASVDMNEEMIKNTTITSDNPLSIMIWGKEIIIDGNPDEDIIINGGNYRIIIQKN